MTMTNPQIDWHITGVFDPDTGVDFAYTVGLVDHGLPELHIWNQPTDGCDPGAGWRLSGRDMQSTLNKIASELVGGSRAVGDRWSTTLDSGLTTVHWHLGPPVERDEVHAYGVAEGAPVVPVCWELERARIEAPVQEQVFFDLTLQLGCLLAGSDTVSADQRTFGAAGAAVAVARRIAQRTDPGVLLRCVAGSGGEERWMTGALKTLLEAADRVSWLDAASAAAEADGRLLAAGMHDPDPGLVKGVGSLFTDVLRVCYLAVAAADLLPHLEPSHGLSWEDLAPNLLAATSDPAGAEALLDERLEPAYELVDRASALGALGEEAARAAMALGWWAATRHGARLDVHRWMDRAEDAGCADDRLLGAAAEVVNGWAVAALPDAPVRWVDAIAPFVEAVR